jgi:hypothetical protein
MELSIYISDHTEMVKFIALCLALAVIGHTAHIPTKLGEMNYGEIWRGFVAGLISDDPKPSRCVDQGKVLAEIQTLLLTYYSN